METFQAPDGTTIVIPDGRVTTYGLTAEQNRLVSAALPSKRHELYDTDVPTDLIAISAEALIINAASLDNDSREMIFDYYTEVGVYDAVFWLGEPMPPRGLRAKFKCYDNFEEIASNLKYHLLSAHSKAKKVKDFSKKLADSLLILSLIRSHPGIKTQELVEHTELQPRTVQRYIATLQAAGEWIEYDTAVRGWRLQHNISILFGDAANWKEWADEE
jgi:hypothetical protein